MYNKSNEVLSQVKDSLKSKKFQEFTRKKESNLKLCKFAYEQVVLADGELPDGPYMTKTTLERIRSCSTMPEFAVPADFSKFKKISGFTCGDAWCPICSYYNARKHALAMSAQMDWMHEELGLEFLMLTLTTPNVKGEELKRAVNDYYKAFRLMFDFVKKTNLHVAGCWRKLEVTYNTQKRITQEMWDGSGKYNDPWKWKLGKMGLGVGDINPMFNTFHPHYHVMLAVEPDYFRDKNGSYISQEKWVELWRKYMSCEISEKAIKVQRVYKIKSESNSGISEIAKYVAKDVDYLYSPAVFRTFYNALKGAKRLTRWGVCQDGNKLFLEGKLDKYIPFDETQYKWAILYDWNGKAYNLKIGRDLSIDEASLVAGMRLDKASIIDEI